MSKNKFKKFILVKCELKNIHIFKTYNAMFQHKLKKNVISIKRTQNVKSKMVLTILVDYLFFCFMEDSVTRIQ